MTHVPLGQPRPARRRRRRVPAARRRRRRRGRRRPPPRPSGPGRRAPVPARADVIAAAGDVLARARPSSPTLVAREAGKVLVEAGGDVQEAVDMARFVAGQGRARLGRDRAVRAAATSWLDHPPARRRRRDDHAVELPGRHPVVEDLPGPAGRQRRRAQAVASTRPPCCEAFVAACVEAGVPAGLVQVVHGFAEPARRARRPPRRRRGQLHRLGADRPQGRGRGDGDRAPARVARARRQERHGRAAPTPTSTSRSTARCSAPSARPASAARRRRGSIVHPDVADELVERIVEAGRRARARRPDSSPAPTSGPVIDRRVGRAHRRRWSTAAVDEGADGRHRRRRPSTVDGCDGGAFVRADRAHRRASPTTASPARRCSGRCWRCIEVDDLDEAVDVVNGVEYGLSAAVYTRDINAALQAVDAHRHRHRLRQRPDDRRRDPAAVRRHQAHRQRLPRGRHPGHRAVQPGEDRVRRLLGPAAEGPDRQPTR